MAQDFSPASLKTRHAKPANPRIFGVDLTAAAKADPPGLKTRPPHEVLAHVLPPVRTWRKSEDPAST